MLALDMPGAHVVVCMGIRICEMPYRLLTVLQASSRPKRSRPPSYDHSSWRLQRHRVRRRWTITCGAQFSPDSEL